ncbi:hypothetical protein Cst_c11820 [Thermoclostridium stercorarium subsp. stercorarium DSM 8532]|jgi:uncharacterized membrane protein YqgA involved in biofilm formation|uniref:DUF554 domain-containing protein n=3 Tax=Thermoclostridium stercorarium TaxID=1510 RepID=L7VN60_THES1|nr:DUF554 domain-containing protein [Thermoclostridium stercorarium]AGC68177.1 hypothetical protein Cst_c11820 [Thermoclostridium stercorarium subsp. stercorarium DSM 8532]ANW98550.1 hypothetical protein CSTERTH_05620 [Thermoclostridium stercorarium subsp. thermolacticum DSM 2910]ANX01087.1 hypothetical protein CSTERLE_05605 [Thermoclostridium stercorarium subsp. leptospartum DSM 9219]UZQ86706.1 DUF554 domain-containing protein [Thermoclostridium stercorarium]
MVGLGTIINTIGIIGGGLSGMFFGKFLKERHQEALKMSCGISVLFIGIAGAMEGMLTVNDNVISSGQTMLITLCLAIGTLIGEIIDIEHLFERFGEWLRLKTGNSNDNSFVNAFVTASLTVCIGAMAIVGAIQDGITGNWSILATKAILDFIIVMVMTCSLGKGCMFSAVPVFIFEGVITALSSLLKPIMTDLAMKYLSLVGSVLIFCVGLNLVWGKKIKVANMLPAIVLAVIAAFLPVSF